MEDETPSASNPAPTGRLAAVTRKQHQIEKLLHDVPSNLAILKKLFTEYLTCVETLYNLTPPGLEDWLNTHKPNIEQFRTEISKNYTLHRYLPQRLENLSPLLAKARLRHHQELGLQNRKLN